MGFSLSLDKNRQLHAKSTLLHVHPKKSNPHLHRPSRLQLPSHPSPRHHGLQHPPPCLVSQSTGVQDKVQQQDGPEHGDVLSYHHVPSAMLLWLHPRQRRRHHKKSSDGLLLHILGLHARFHQFGFCVLRNGQNIPLESNQEIPHVFEKVLSWVLQNPTTTKRWTICAPLKSKSTPDGQSWWRSQTKV